MDFVQTRLGVVAIEEPPGSGPAVMVVPGAFQPTDYLSGFDPGLPAGSLRLPACGAPLLDTLSIEACAAAFDEALPNRPIILMGISTGATVALNMQAPQVVAVVAVEPFLSTGELWPLIDHWQPNLHRMRAKEARFVEEVFGYHRDRIEARSFAIRTRAPITALVGREPLQPRRQLAMMPSLTSHADRERLHRHGAEVVVCDGGHDICSTNPKSVTVAVERAYRPILI